MTNRSQRVPALAAGGMALYYLMLALNGQRLGYHTSEALFLTEKAMIIWQGTGDKLPVLGLTFPVLPFFFSLPFSALWPLAGPVIASVLGMAGLYFLVLDDQRYMPRLIRLGTTLTFMLHPGLLFAACSGRSVYAVLLFGYLFFRSLLAYYRSNTTYHVSLASLCLVGLVFSSFEFVWLSLFLLPLVLFMSLQSLSLGEGDTLLRLGLAFNNLSLRRKLVNKSFALLILLFMLPLAGLLVFGLLNKVYAGDPQYFLNSSYANWRVLTDQVLWLDSVNQPAELWLPDLSLLVSVRRLAYAPLLVLILIRFRSRMYQLLTLLSPFALIEFLHIKNSTAPLMAEFYQIFLVLGWAGLATASAVQLRGVQRWAFGLMLVQIVAGVVRMGTATPYDEHRFTQTVLRHPLAYPSATETDELVRFITQLPPQSRILADDATAYSIIARTQTIQPFVLAYQQTYRSALANPRSFVDFVLVHSETNQALSHSSFINGAYLGGLRTKTAQAWQPLRRYEWILYPLDKGTNRTLPRPVR